MTQYNLLFKRKIILCQDTLTQNKRFTQQCDVADCVSIGQNARNREKTAAGHV